MKSLLCPNETGNFLPTDFGRMHLGGHWFRSTEGKVADGAINGTSLWLFWKISELFCCFPGKRDLSLTASEGGVPLDVALDVRLCKTWTQRW